jgi:hypothetical protein
MEAKMTKEEREQSMEMMNAMKDIQAQGGTMKDFMDLMAKNMAKGDKAPKIGPAGPKDPKVIAEELKTSLEGIKESADYLLKSEFVK